MSLLTVSSFISFIILFSPGTAEACRKPDPHPNYATKKIFLSVNNSKDQCLVVKRPWISEMFAEAESIFTMYSRASHKCKNDFALYKLHLSQNTDWAVRISESSEWPRLGLLAGTLRHYGNFDECLAVDGFGFQGKYCLVQTEYDLKYFMRVHKPMRKGQTLPPGSSAYATLQMYQFDTNRCDRKNLKWAICIPSSCTNEDLSESLKRILHPIFEKHAMTVSSTVHPLWCKTSGEPKLQLEFYLASIFFLTFVSIVLLASLREFMTNASMELDPGLPSKLLTCFALQKSWKKLMHFTLEREYMFIHYEKVLTMMYNTVMHRYALLSEHMQFNMDGYEKMMFSFNAILLMFPNTVDIMFFFSGFLMCYDFLKSSRKTFFDILLRIVKRWLRLFLTYMVLKIFFAYVVPYMGDGPAWHEMQNEAEICKQNWLMTAFNLPSIRDWDKLCYVPSWQITVDLHLLILASVFLYITEKNRKLGLVSIVASIIISSAIVFMRVYQHRYQGVIAVSLRIPAIARQKDNEILNALHTALPVRLGPYMLGVLSAYAAVFLKEQRYTFSKVHQILAAYACLSVYLWVKLYGNDKYSLIDDYNVYEQALYAAVSQLFLNIPWAYIHCVYIVNGYEEKIGKYIPRMFVPLDRLTYGVYMAHFIYMQHQVYSQRRPLYYANHSDRVQVLVSDLLFSYFYGFILFLFLEAPIHGITLVADKMLNNALTTWLHKFKKKNSPSPKRKNSNPESVKN